MAKSNPKRLNRSGGGDVLLVFLLTLMAAVMVLPFVYAVVNAFKPLEEFYIFPPKFYVVNPTINNFLDLFTLTNNLWIPFSRYLFNSVYTSVAGTILSVCTSAMAAYVLAKKHFHGKTAWSGIITISMLFTSQIIGIPQYVIMSTLGWVDTHMVVLAPMLGMTMGVFLMKQFMEGVPDAIIESARNMNIYVEFQTLDNLGDIIARIKSQGGQIYEVDLDRGREERSKNPSAVFSIRLPGRHYHVRVLAAISELESVYTIDEI